MIEKEPMSREADEAVESEPKQQSPDTSHQKEEPKAATLPIEQVTPKPAREIAEVSVSFENLHELVGKNILFRDPHTQPNRTDDPYHKAATIEQHEGKFVIVIDRGRYYPYYTDDRQNIFTLDSQEDIDRYEVEIER